MTEQVPGRASKTDATVSPTEHVVRAKFRAVRSDEDVAAVKAENAQFLRGATTAGLFATAMALNPAVGIGVGAYLAVKALQRATGPEEYILVDDAGDVIVDSETGEPITVKD